MWPAPSTPGSRTRWGRDCAARVRRARPDLSRRPRARRHRPAGRLRCALGRLANRGILRAGPAVIVIAAPVGSDLYGLGGNLVLVVVGIVTVAVVDPLAEEPPSALAVG
jgi:hypothetical protein